MAQYLDGVSKTFSEFLLVPGQTTRETAPSKISLKTPVAKHKIGEEASLFLNIPFASAMMQAVSDDKLAMALARSGGLSFIYSSQPIEDQAEMVERVKKFKAGFVSSDSTLGPEQTMADALALKGKTSHTTVAVTIDGRPNGKLVGILTSRDYRPGRTPETAKISELMTPREKLVIAREGLDLEEANDLIWEHKLNVLPVLDDHDCLKYLVFRKDYEEHHKYNLELIDEEKRLLVGAAINTHDFKERAPALVRAGADALCVDSSDGFSDYQKETIQFVKKEFPRVVIGGGNVVDAEGFRFLAEAGADFVKVGIGGGSICITREQKGIGRGQASAVMDVANARDKYLKETGVYMPVCSDGGIAHDYHVSIALALGADFVMLGRYFARFDEAPGRKVKLNGGFAKEYWGEGSERARNWQRYGDGEAASKMSFAEGVDAYVPYDGRLKDNLDIALAKLKSTMASCGAQTIADFHKNAKVVEVSPASIRENGAHDVILKDNLKVE